MNTGEPQEIPPRPAAAQYTRFDTGAEFQRAIDTLLAQSGRELRIFDPDMEAWRVNAAERVEQLERFLQGSRTRRLYVVVHEPGHITTRCPRLMQLLARYSHVIQINRTDESIRSLQDSFAALDARHYLRRPVARFFRGALGLDDEAEALAMRSRFLEIWAASTPSVSSTTAGL